MTGNKYMTALLWKFLGLSKDTAAASTMKTATTAAETVRLRKIFSFVEDVHCLTLYGEKDRQRSAVTELVGFGFDQFRFVAGYDRYSPEVEAAYASGMVAEFPNCFRCNQLDCGKEECNNTLIEPQVGNFLSFLRIFREIAASQSHVHMVVEDDLRFLPYDVDVLQMLFSLQSEQMQRLTGPEPVLIRLANPRPAVLQELDKTYPQPTLVPDCNVPSNPAFIINRSFAKLALDHFEKITHTSDNYIHQQLARYAHCLTLHPPLVDHKSGKGLVHGTIHPRAMKAKTRLEPNSSVHIKHTLVADFAIIGSPRCGTAYSANLLSVLGLPIGHERLAEAGIASWMFAVKDVDLPFGEDLYARNSRFVYPKTIGLVYRDHDSALPSLLIENSKNIQSYEFRRKWIYKLLGTDLNEFLDQEVRAMASFIYWYKICLQRDPKFVIRLSYLTEDARAVARRLGFNAETIADELISAPVNAQKKYHGHVFKKRPVDVGACMARLPDELMQELAAVQHAVDALASTQRG